MTDNIKPIRPGTEIVGVEPNQDVVDMLEHMLSRAKSGEIVSAAVAAWTHDNSSLTCFEIGVHAFSLLGAVNRLQGRIDRAIEG